MIGLKTYDKNIVQVVQDKEDQREDYLILCGIEFHAHH